MTAETDICATCKQWFATRRHWGRLVVRWHNGIDGRRCGGSMKAAWVDPSERWIA